MGIIIKYMYTTVPLSRHLKVSCYAQGQILST